MSLFKGLGNGKYAAPRKLTQRGGKPLMDNYALSPCMGDWDGDGDYDMALGAIQGPVKLLLNNGDLSFTEAGDFRVDGKILERSDGGPCIVDWDGDGILDLIVGEEPGSVLFLKGTAKGSLDLTKTAGSELVEGAKPEELWRARSYDSTSPIPFTPKKPGLRTKPYAADWNGDGKLDLLVGDMLQIEKPKPNLTKAQQNERVRLEKEERTTQERMMKLYQKISDSVRKKLGISGTKEPTTRQYSQMAEGVNKELARNKEVQTLQARLGAINTKLSKLRPTSELTGVVWVYLRK